MSDPIQIAQAQRWAMIAAENRAALEEVVRLAGQFPNDCILADLGKRAKSGLAALASHEQQPRLDSAYGSIGTWGQNGHGPKIRNMLSSARFHADRLAARAVKVAA